MKIYVASSWRNKIQQEVVKILRELGHQVYDFRNPPGRTGFSWGEIDSNWSEWTPKEFRGNLNHELAIEGFKSDFEAMQWADCCVMVLPSGRSAHTEAGWMKGAGKVTYVFQVFREEPELMYKVYDGIITSFNELNDLFKRDIIYCSAGCGVPKHLHGTCCGWINASFITNPRNNLEQQWQNEWRRANPNVNFI